MLNIEDQYGRLMNRTLIFMGIEFVHPKNMSDLEKEYPDLISQREELESNSEWPDKDSSFTNASNPYAMIRKMCNDKKVLHVHIPLYCFSYNNIAKILLKVSKNKEKLGNLFTIYSTHRLNDIKFKTIISEISSNEKLDTSILN